jgi:uncharacterized protein
VIEPPGCHPLEPGISYRHLRRLAIIPSACTVLIAAALGSALVLSGCGTKSLSKAEARAVTSELVSAAENATAHRSEITIRPEGPSGTVRFARAPIIENIYVTLPDASQAASLKQSFVAVARRHGLSFAASASSGVLRFDFAREGTRTHSVHVVTPVARRAHATLPLGTEGPRLALILDDLGYDRAAADALLALPFPLTVSVLPHLPLSTEVAEEAYRRGHEVLLHLPMESEADGAKPENVELRVGMSAGQVESNLAGMLDTVPHAVGVNNHQGSRATADSTLMAALMPALRRRRLFFIDSRTTASTVAYEVAERSGVAAASRKVFLDDTATREAILAQLDLAARDALRDGSAIAIGHPRPATLRALTDGVPRIEARGVRLVFVSEIVH